MTRLGLSLNEAKTSIKDARTEGFDFLGYTLGPKFAPLNGRKYPGASPSRKSVQRIKDKIGDFLASGNKAPWPQVRTRLNRLLERRSLDRLGRSPRRAGATAAPRLLRPQAAVKIVGESRILCYVCSLECPERA